MTTEAARPERDATTGRRRQLPPEAIKTTIRIEPETWALVDEAAWRARRSINNWIGRAILEQARRELDLTE